MYPWFPPPSRRGTGSPGLLNTWRKYGGHLDFLQLLPQELIELLSESSLFLTSSLPIQLCFSSQPRSPTPIAGCGKVEGGEGGRDGLSASCLEPVGENQSFDLSIHLFIHVIIHPTNIQNLVYVRCWVYSGE